MKRMRCKKCGYEFIQVHVTPREDHTQEQCDRIMSSFDEWMRTILDNLPIERMWKQ